MSSLVRSFASLYCQKLRCTTRLGRDNLPAAVAAARFPAFHRRRSFSASGPHRGAGKEYIETSSSSAAGTRRPAALPRQQGQEREPFFTWARLAIGSVVAFAAPFLHSRWASFLRIRSEVEMVEDAAEVVEEMAAAAEKLSAEVTEQLPEDGRLRRAAVLAEHASREVAEEAHLARDILHKVDEIEEDVKAMIEPIVSHGRHGDGKAQHNSNH